ncbi:MAG: hypothetical protein OJF60_002187 [Burkholderiaceae bacterium]|jgi:putative DNA primase/helicase|nr:MAG: hypothetical protein OJF60_002187 [Burkholderiaceae bacterium]
MHWTISRDLSGRSKLEHSGTWADIVALVTSPREYPEKTACPLLSLSTYGDARTEAGSLRHGANVVQCYGIEGDYDAEQVTPSEAAAMLSAAGIKAVIYTTARHTRDRPRWRILAPLSQPCAPAGRAHWVGVLNAALGGILAPESFTLSQSFYIGKVTGAPYECHVVEGQPIDAGPHLFFDPVFPAGRADQTGPAAADADDAALLAMAPKMPAPPLEVIASALAAIPNDGPPDWHSYSAIIWAVADGTGSSPEGRALALAWSQKNPSHNLREFDHRWGHYRENSSAKGGGITVATLLHKAKACGWVDPRTASRREMADVQLARMLAANLAEQHFCYEHNGVGWRKYCGGAWAPCRMGEEREVAKAVGTYILTTLANDNSDSDKTKRLLALAHRASTVAGVNGTLNLVQSDERVRMAPELFDANPHLLNCTNGVIDLRTGELLPHDPAQRMSRQCTVEYRPEAPTTLWSQFLRDVSCDDAAWVGFLQRWSGYMLTGLVREEVLLFAVGRGANGKSVVANIFQRIMGNYCVTMPTGLLTVSNRDGEAATPALATLAGARLALMNETEAGSRFSGQVIKTLASTERITARQLHRAPFTFSPSHKPFIRGNHKPIIADSDDGVWRRILLLMFNRQFAPHERDKHMETKLMREAPGILAWMVRGAVEYYRSGLMVPECVLSASREYRRDSDLLGHWLDEECEVGPRFDCRQVEAFASYTAWCRSQEVRPLSKPAFTRALAERGFTAGRLFTRGDRAHTYRGIRLICDFLQVANDASDLFA